MNSSLAARLRPWVLATRLKTLPAAVVPVAVGTALARREGAARGGVALGCALFALLVQVFTNLCNDYYDSLRGADTPARRGPLRVTAAGLVTHRRMRLALALVLGAAVLAGLPLAIARGLELVPLGVLCLLAGFAYTGGPYPLAYHGLGDLFVVLFFGVAAVTGTAYAQTGASSLAAALAGLGVGLLCDDLLVVNNGRDLATDAAAGKRTLVVHLGLHFARWQYALQALAAFALPFALGWRPGLAALVAAPLTAFAGARFARAETGPDFNGALGLTAASLLLYGLALAAGLAWW